jgi:hypothetical protein
MFALLVLHHTKFGINGQFRNKLFLIVMFFSLVRAAMNALRIWKMRNGVSRMPSISSFFNGPSAQ